MFRLFSKIGSGLGAVLALVLAVLAAAGTVFAVGRRSKGAEDARDKAVGEKKAVQAQLDMHREADKIEQRVEQLPVEGVDKELGKWDRK